MGPFKHTVDDGLDIRKAAFECMYTLLEQGLERVDVMQFLEHVQAGLKDHYDIKMLTYLMTARLALLCPSAVLQSKVVSVFLPPIFIKIVLFFCLELDQFVEPLRATCTLKVKANSVKQEYEKQDELKRSALRALAALASIPKAGELLLLLELFSVSIDNCFHYKLMQIFTDKNQQLSDFLKFIKDSPELVPIFQLVQKDSNSTNQPNTDNSSMDQS